MKIKWYGQACMVLETFGGTKIMCDPYDESYGYELPKEEVDILTVSHMQHCDHNAVEIVRGNPKIINETGEYEEKGLKIKGIHTWHDSEFGSKRGDNIVYRFEVDNIFFVHMGDIGHILTDDQVKEITPCDILAVPVGGTYTVDADEAYEIVKQLNPQVVIPIHYHTPSNRIGLDTAEHFLEKFLEIKREKIWEGSRVNITNFQTAYALYAHGEKI
jgi:L-ascorbate metabolism protein UlaG (beta-lactamase superfamily)